jgi:4-carboxymuconolactone decarboxylase
MNQQTNTLINAIPNNQSRFEQGLAMLEMIDGKTGPDHALIESLKELAPDFGRYLVEFLFVDLYTRPGLDLKSKEIVTIGAATTLGAIPTLKVHMQAAINVGVTRQEIVEVLLLLLVYAGFPRTINALLIAKEVFVELDRPGN